MKVEDLFTGNKSEINLRIKPALKSDNFQQLDLSIVRVSYVQNIYWLVDSKSNRVEIEGVGPKDNANLDLVVSEQSITIVIEGNNKNNKLTLKTKLFNEKITLVDNIEIGYGDIILDDIDIEVSTIHGAKGETHEATLYLETFYKKNDVGEILEIINNTNCDITKAELRKKMKMAYVGMSRPRSLLCIAVSERSINGKKEKLIELGWDIKNVAEILQEKE